MWRGYSEKAWLNQFSTFTVCGICDWLIFPSIKTTHHCIDVSWANQSFKKWTSVEYRQSPGAPSLNVNLEEILPTVIKACTALISTNMAIFQLTWSMVIETTARVPVWCGTDRMSKHTGPSVLPKPRNQHLNVMAAPFKTSSLSACLHQHNKQQSDFSWPGSLDLHRKWISCVFEQFYGK